MRNKRCSVKKDCLRSQFTFAVNLLHHLATSASGCSSIKKDCLRSLFTFAVNLKRTNPQQVRVVLFRRFFETQAFLETLLRKKKDCLRSLLFLAGAVGIEPTP